MKYYIIISLVLFVRCESHQTEKSNFSEKIVLIIKNCPNYSSFVDSKNIRTSNEEDHEILYLDDSLVYHTYTTSFPTKIDTVIFPVYSKLIEIVHIYKAYGNLSFLFQAGDTILFTYDNDFPEATVLNREFSNHELNYERYRRDVLAISKPYDAFEGYQHAFHLNISKILKSRSTISTNSIVKSYKKETLEKAKDEWNIEKKFLDSLLVSQLILKKYYDFYRMKGQIRMYQIEKDFAFQEQNLIEKNIDRPISDIKSWNDFRDNLTLDDPIRFGFYRDALTDDTKKRHKNDIPVIKGVNKKIEDSRVYFDSLILDTIYTVRERTFLLTQQLEKIIENFSESDIDKYAHIYWSEVDNEAIKNDFIKKYGDQIPLDLVELGTDSLIKVEREPLQMHLVNNELKENSFDNILNKHNGKLIYVDFWSSTCIPCLVSMPYAHELINEYANQKVAFIFISLDKEADRWTKASKKARLSDFTDSYMVDATKESPFLDKYDIRTIPRYMLFDHNSNLIHRQAFSPNTDEIRASLNIMLNKMAKD